MPDDAYNLEIEDDQSWSLTLSDQGVAVPADHAASHAAAGSDPITISNTQVTGLGTMSTQAASAVAITGGAISAVTISGATLTEATMSATTLVADTADINGGTVDNASVGQTIPAAGSFTTLSTTGTATLVNLAVSGTVTFTTALPVAQGGTSGTTQATARSGLGLGTISTQAADNVTLSGGTIDGVLIGDGDPQDGGFLDLFCTSISCTGALNVGSLVINDPVEITNGGTEADNIVDARTNLEVFGKLESLQWNSTITALTGGGSTRLDGQTIGAAPDYPIGSLLSFVVSGALHVYRATNTGAAESSPNIIRPDSYSGSEWTLVNMIPSAVAITGGTISGLSSPMPVASGGTGANTLTGTLVGNGTSAVTAATSSTVGQVLRCTGANTFAYGALNLADTDAVTGVLPAANGGTGGDFALVSGTGTLVAGSATITDANVTANSRIVPVHTTTGLGTSGPLYIDITPGVGFDVVSTSGTDANDFLYFGHY